ncbi:hypothetical protein PGB90_002408 [Kerria lacca]
MVVVSNLEEFVSHVETYTINGKFIELGEMLNKSYDLLTSELDNLDSLLESFNLENHSMTILAILYVKLSSIRNIAQPIAVFTQLTDFALNADINQLQHVPETFADLFHLYTKTIIEIRKPESGIYTLERAIAKLQEHPSQLTTLHADFCQLCLLSKNFKPALPILNNDITSISKEGGSTFDTKSFLLYYYYGGMIYTAVKNFERALYFYEIVITTPAMTVSHIMLEAYKKYILVSLLINGKIINVPKHTSQVLGRFIRPLSQAYSDLATAYQTSNYEEFSLCFIEFKILYRDKNMGLAKQVLASLYKRNIHRLTKTFLTLSLNDVTNRAKLDGVEQVESYILDMIESNKIFATINIKDGMVIFHDDPEKYNNPILLEEIEQQIESCVKIDKEIRSMEETVELNPSYIKKVNIAPDEDLGNQKLSANFAV